MNGPITLAKRVATKSNNSAKPEEIELAPFPVAITQKGDPDQGAPARLKRVAHGDMPRLVYRSTRDRGLPVRCRRAPYDIHDIGVSKVASLAITVTVLNRRSSFSQIGKVAICLESSTDRVELPSVRHLHCKDVERMQGSMVCTRSRNWASRSRLSLILMPARAAGSAASNESSRATSTPPLPVIRRQK